MKKVGIIGAGIFGCSAAIELAKKGFIVTVFERMNNILDGASTRNHLRHHYGFHYPRSKKTVEEIKTARRNFEKEYGECISESFDNFYGISKNGSKITPEDFIKFCKKLDLPYEISWPNENYINKSKISLCIKTPERVYDPDILKGIIFQKMKKLRIILKLNSKIIGGSIFGKIKTLKICCKNKNYEEDFDYVVNATYYNFNNFNKWFKFQRKVFQYELMELLELSLPSNKKVGLTIMDGNFSSVLPRGEKGTFTLGHVDASVLKVKTSNEIGSMDVASGNLKSNWKEILNKGIEDFPFLKDAQLIKSLFITRVVRADVGDTDERLSEITGYGNGMYSIFGGKIITSVDIAKDLTERIIKEDSKVH